MFLAQVPLQRELRHGAAVPPAAGAGEPRLRGGGDRVVRRRGLRRRRGRVPPWLGGIDWEVREDPEHELANRSSAAT